MITFNSMYLMTVISHFFWPFLRISAFFFTVPFFNDKIIYRKYRIILSALVSWLILPFLPDVKIFLFSSLGFYLLFQQILIGIFLGLIFQLLFSVINISGEFISLQMGLSFSTFLDFYSHIS
ncbi:flagellar biosynthetic protein FliR, partial [Buchnera aphidicola]|nr:flagellar biosynthetic protein FliR [Buchnera aphidicola]